MKLGIYIGTIAPEEGGGHTFQDTIIRELMTRPEDDVDVTLFYYGELPSELAGGTRLNYEHLQGGGAVSRSVKGMSLISRDGLSGLIYGDSNVLKEGALHRSASTLGIELMWFPTNNFEYTSIPYAFTVWDIQHKLQPFFPEVSAAGRWESRENYFQQILSQATYVITGTQAGKQELQDHYNIPEEKIRLLLHPVPQFALQENRPGVDIRAKYGIENDFIFYPAQIWLHKNHSTLLVALHQLKDEPISLVLAGSDGGAMAHVQDLIGRFNLGSKVHVLGFIPNEDLEAFYYEALALTYPTLFGPENLPPLEAFGIGCPVIASNVHGAEEQLGDAAIIIEATDPSAWAETILRLRDDHALRTALISKGKERAHQYTSANYVADMLSVANEMNG